MTYTIEEYLKGGFQTSKEIQAEAGLSQSTVTRKIKEMSDRIVAVREGRRVQYATTCNAYGANDRLPLGIIDSKGQTTIFGDIRPLAHGGNFLALDSRASRLYLGEGRNGVYDDLPYFLYDARPQSFLGQRDQRIVHTKVALYQQ